MHNGDSVIFFENKSIFNELQCVKDLYFWITLKFVIVFRYWNSFPVDVG